MEIPLSGTYVEHKTEKWISQEDLSPLTMFSNILKRVGLCNYVCCKTCESS